MWPPGVSLLVSAMVLFLLNRHLKQGPRPTPRPAISDEHVKYARKPTVDAANSKIRSTRRFSAENDTGWFMFIPTGVWPFIIGALGVFLVVGDVVESVVTRQGIRQGPGSGFVDWPDPTFPCIVRIRWGCSGRSTSQVLNGLLNFSSSGAWLRLSPCMVGFAFGAEVNSRRFSVRSNPIVGSSRRCACWPAVCWEVITTRSSGFSAGREPGDSD